MPKLQSKSEDYYLQWSAMHFATALHIAGGYTSACAVRLKLPSTRGDFGPANFICFDLLPFTQCVFFTHALELLECMIDTGDISQIACPVSYMYSEYFCAKPQRTLVDIYCVDTWHVLY